MAAKNKNAFAYTPLALKAISEEMGTPQEQPFVKQSKEERHANAKKWSMILKI